MAYKNFKVETDADGIAVVTWDIPGKSMNVLDETTGLELADIVNATTKDAAIKGVVLTSGKEAFSGGADLTMLEGMNRLSRPAQEQGRGSCEHYVFEEVRKLSQTLQHQASHGKPWVAAINGLLSARVRTGAGVSLSHRLGESEDPSRPA